MKQTRRIPTADSAILSVPRFFGMLAIVSAVELAIMLALPVALPESAPLLRNVVDAFLVGLLSAPLLWWLVVAPLRKAEGNRANEAYQSMVRTAIDGFWLVDTQGRLLDVNAAYGQITGYTRGELLGMRVSDLETGETPDQVAQHVQRVIERGGDRFETRHRCKDGRLVDLDVSVNYVARDGGRFFVFLRDVTQHKKGEETLRQRQRELTLRNRIADIFLTRPDDRMYDEVLKVVLEATASQYGIFGFIDQNGALVVPSMTRHIWEQCRVPEKTTVFPKDRWGESVWPRAIRPKKTLFSNEPSSLTPEGHVPIRRNITVPILDQHEVIGLFQVANKETNYDADDVSLLETIAEAVAPVLHARLQRDAQEKERRRAEDEIRHLNSELERRVIERTADLAKTNQNLAAEMAERKQAEEQLQESEKRFRDLVENVPVGISISTLEGGVLVVNPTVLELFGYDSPEEFTQVPAAALYCDQKDRERFVELLKRAPVKGFEARFKRKDGTIFWGSVTSIAKTTELGRVQFLNAVEDITKRRQAEEEIRRFNEDLERRVQERTAELEVANKELEAFAHSVSHDLRAPLRGIDGWTRALEEDYGDKLDQTGKEYLQTVRSETQRMGRLIDDLLELSRVTRQELRRETVDLSRMAEFIARRFREAEPNRKVDLVIASGLTAEGDRNLLGIVLENLLGNAWKFTSKHAQARIEFGLTDKDGAPAYFLKDDGAGFDMRYAGKLFAPFQRLHRPSEFPGTGVGLATVQRIIHRHGTNCRCSQT